MDRKKQGRTNTEIGRASIRESSKRMELSSLFVCVRDQSRKESGKGKENSRHEERR